MEQCKRCRHSFLEQDDLLCRERTGSVYQHEGDKEVLNMKPRQCLLLNPNDDCVLFQREPGWSLRKILNRLRT
jgi:hypothetical protein